MSRKPSETYKDFDSASSLKAEAEHWFKQGIPVVPMKREVPCIEWTEWEKRKQTSEEFNALPWDEADGFAVICNSKTQLGYVGVIRFDVKNVSEEARKRGLRILEFLPRTRVEKTSSDELNYIYFSKKPVKSNSSYHDFCGLEVLGEGMLCIMAPSEGHTVEANHPIELVEDLAALLLLKMSDADCLPVMAPLDRRERLKSVQKYAAAEIERDMVHETGGISLGDYRLVVKNPVAIVIDKNGEPVWSAKLSSLQNLQTKKDLAKKLTLNESIVDRAVAQLALTLGQAAGETATETTSSDPELVEKAKVLLKDPMLICKIIQALRQRGLIGETRNALTCFFDMLSAKTPNPINRRWSGRSGIGKTTIVVKVASLFPPEMVMELSGVTKKTLWYHPDVVEVDENTEELSLEGKILILLEESESKEFLDEVKPLLSHDEYVLEYAFVEKVDGVNITHKMRLRGWPAYIGITTEPELREEQQTRALLATPDRGREKWKTVIVADAEAAASLEQPPQDDLLPIIQEAIRQLKPYKVWIPWLPVLAHLFPHDDAKSMREWHFLHSFLNSIAILHQQQLPRVVVNGEERLAAPAWILEIAAKIAEASLAETISKLPRDVQEFIDHLDRQPAEEWSYKELQREYQKCFGESIPMTTLKRRYVEKLVDEGLLEVDDSKKPYKVKFLEKRSTDSTIFEKSLEIIRSGEINDKIMEEISSTRDSRAEQLLAFDADGKPIPLDKLITNLCSARVVDNVLKAVSKSKEEEYAVSERFSKLVESVEAFLKKKQDSQGSSRGEANVEIRYLCQECLGVYMQQERLENFEDLKKEGLCEECGKSGSLFKARISVKEEEKSEDPGNDEPHVTPSERHMGQKASRQVDEKDTQEGSGPVAELVAKLKSLEGYRVGLPLYQNNSCHVCGKQHEGMWKLLENGRSFVMLCEDCFLFWRKHFGGAGVEQRSQL